MGQSRYRAATVAAFGVLVFLGVAGSPGAAGAAEPDEVARDADEPTDDRSVEGGTIFVRGVAEEIPTSNTIVSKFPVELRRTPASVAVVGSDELEERGARVLGEALQGVSGVNVQSQNGVVDFFLVRGFDSVSSSLILVDGAREPESSFYQMYNVDRVEVLKGPSAFVYGGSPLASSVNIVRHQPRAGSLLDLRLEGGSYSTFEGTVDANVSTEDGAVAFRVGGLWRESDGYRDGRTIDDLAVNPSLSWRIGERSLLNVSYERVELDRQPDSGLPLVGGEVADVPSTRSYQSPFDLSEQTADRFQVDFESHLSDNLVLRDKIYYRKLDWLSRATVPNGVFPFPGGDLQVARTLLELDDTQAFTGNQLELLWRASTGRVSHNLLFGLELSRLEDDLGFDVFLLPTIGLDNPVETAVEPLFPIPGQARSADTETTIVAPYVIDQIGLSERWDLFLGLRWDVVNFDDAVSGVSRDDDQLSPMVGLVFSPTENLSVWANSSRAFAAPSTFAVSEAQVPEESEQFEVGLRSSLADGRVDASLALFRIERRNIAIPDGTGLVSQVGDQRSSGLEIEVRARPSADWRIDFNYAYTDAELTEFRDLVFSQAPPFFAVLDRSGNAPPFAPEHLADARVSRRLPAGFELSLGARFLGAQSIDEDNAFQLDDELLLDLAGSWSRGVWGLDLRLENLTDEEWYTRGFDQWSVIPAPGFTVRSAIRYSLSGS